MNSNKTCAVCAAVLPENSVSEWCVQCTPAAPAEPSRTIEWLAPDDEGDFLEKPKFRASDTHVAAAAQFLTGKADSNPFFTGSRSKYPKIPGHVIIGELGRGSGGLVLEAVQTKTGRRFAVKLLFGRDPVDLERFNREIRALAKFQHPGVVGIFEVGESDRGPYFTMELMPGGSLSELLKKAGKLPAPQAADWVGQMARALAAVHDAKLLHRDLKPGNILLTAEGKPKIADFGLVKTSTIDSMMATIGQLTGTNAVVGTPAYMSLEQAEARHDDVDKRSDIYALGAILYHCLTGQPPFSARTSHQIVGEIIKGEFQRPSRLTPGLDRELEAICLKCLDRRPAERYQSANELADDLENWQRGDKTIARPASLTSRAMKWAYRQRRFAAASVICLIFAMLINVAVAIMLPDKPHKQLDAILKEIREYRKVVLVDATGAPRWYDESRGLVRSSPSEFGGDSFCFGEHGSERLVELLREEDVPRCFILQAEVRHDSAESNSTRVGLYIGRWNIRQDDGRRQNYMHLLTIDDIDQPGRFPNQKNYAHYAPTIDLSVPDRLTHRHPLLFSMKEIDSPSLLAHNRWRTLSYVVHKDRVEFHCSPEGPGDPAFDPPAHLLSDITENMELLHNDTLRDLPFPKRLRDNPLTGGLGLYVNRGKASFRNVTIQKIDE